MSIDNRRLLRLILTAIAAVAVVGAGRPRRSDTITPRVTLLRTPDGGIQPQAVVDQKGVLHLIYLKGDPASADIYYVQKAPGDADFSKPIRVNSADRAIAVGTVRGPQLAIGRNGLVHVAWMGAHPEGPNHVMPMLYTHLNDSGTGFEPERNVMQFATGLDGGASVAADNFGNVYVVWHANPSVNGEAHRRVWMARSSDDGRTFSRERAIDPDVGGKPIGACGCCGMRALTDSRGTLYVFYRAATEGIHRDMTLLISHDHGEHFVADCVAKWELNACPMSTDFISESGPDTLVAWETAGQVFYARVEPGDKVSEPVAPPGPGGDRKHPVVIRNRQSQTLLAWTDGTGWQRGGSVMWQVYDREGKLLDANGAAPGLPVWDLVAAYQDGGFTLVY